MGRIKNPLPPPRRCDVCGGDRIQLVDSKVIYGKTYEKSPMRWLCLNSKCGAHVGCHPDSYTPLGKMADAATRTARRRAHAAFDPIWQASSKSRGEWYRRLAQRLGIPKEECHIAWFDKAACEKVVALCEDYKRRKELAKRQRLLKKQLEDKQPYLKLY